MQNNGEKEHVWRLELAPTAETSEEGLLELVRTFLRDFLNLGYFTHHGKQVEVDGFAFGIDPERIHHIFTRSDGTDD